MDSPDREALIRSVLTDNPELFERTLRINPRALIDSWDETMTAISATRPIDTGRFLRAILRSLRRGNVRRTLDHPIDEDGNTIAHWAALQGDGEKIEVLARHGVDVGLPNVFGTTPLFDAVRSGCPGIVEIVAARLPGDHLRRVNGYDCSPMHWACKHQSLAGARALAGLDPALLNLPNGRGALPLDLLDWGRLDFARLTREALGREPTEEDLEPFASLDGWMRSAGAAHSAGWRALADEERPEPGNSPFDAELWPRHLRRRQALTLAST